MSVTRLALIFVAVLMLSAQEPSAKSGNSCALGSMHWSFLSNGARQPVVELLVTDPKGRRLGQDVAANKGYEEIPRATYGMEGGDDDDTGESGDQIGLVDFCEPEPGDYKVQVFGKATGKYSLEVYASAAKSPGQSATPEAAQSSAMLDNISIKKGEVQNLSVKYSRDPQKIEVAKSQK